MSFDVIRDYFFDISCDGACVREWEGSERERERDRERETERERDILLQYRFPYFIAVNLANVFQYPS